MAPPPPRPEDSPSLVARALAAARARGKVAAAPDNEAQRERPEAPVSAGARGVRGDATPAQTRTPAQAGVQGDEAQRPRLWVPASAGAREEAEAHVAASDDTAKPSPLRWLAALALLLGAGPAFTWAGATLLTQRTRAEIAALAPRATPLLVRSRADAATRDALAPLLDRAPLGTTLERLATTLPTDDRVASVASNQDGALRVVVLTADPDALRDALRREPVLAQLKEAGQQRDEATLRVTLAGPPQ